MHLVLHEFILIPHLLHQFERMFSIPCRFISFSAKITRSSTNSSDEIIFSLQWTPNPAVLISSARSFINIDNSMGERMQPCFYVHQSMHGMVLNKSWRRCMMDDFRLFHIHYKLTSLSPDPLTIPGSLLVCTTNLLSASSHKTAFFDYLFSFSFLQS